ncbi:MAG: pyrroline-5-carboxylate reductase [Caldimicrobium sp.]
MAKGSFFDQIGIIGGGQMAEALIRGFLEKEMFFPKNILVSEPLKERRQYLEEFYNVKTTEDNKKVVEERNLILLAVKPQVMGKVLDEIKDKINPKKHLILTIAAGLPLSFYEKRLPQRTKIVRIMPNTCALVHKSISAISKGPYVEEEEVSFVEKLFSVVGEVIKVEESYMDAVTALSGSGPAYVSLFLEALIDAGVRCGLPRGISEKLALSTLEGTIEMIKKTKKNPYEIKAMVTSPGGTTITALEEFYKKGFPGIVIKAVKKAYERGKELSQLLEEK